MESDGIDVFLRRAGDFSRGMKLLRDDESYAQSAALLAVHTAIAYTDALRRGLGDTILSSDDHRTAVSSLRNKLVRDDTDGISRLQKLLAAKSEVAYGASRVDPKRLQLLCVESERYQRWANKVGVAEGIVGWRSNDD